MSKKEDGGPAFPVVFDDSVHAEFSVERGISVRDYFAAAAMQGLISLGSVDYKGETKAQGIARNAYVMADAMLEARKQ